MADSLGTTQMRMWVSKIQNGDVKARDELLRMICGRAERLARKMLRDYPAVQRWADADDVLQNALLRLLRSLQEVRPGSMREFYGLAALQIRRELIDLARHFRGPEGPGQHEVSLDPSSLAGHASPHADLDTDLGQWCAFHEAVDGLPTEEREVVGLIFYHGWTQADVAELFQTTDRSIRRWWQSARLKLHEQLKKLDARN